MLKPNYGYSIFRGVRHKKSMGILFIMMLVCSLFTCVFVNDSTGSSLADAVHVKNEKELRDAINNASAKGTIIALDNDITLTNSTYAGTSAASEYNNRYNSALIIPEGKDITLTSNKALGYYKLISAVDASTITVDKDSVLKLDGIIITHANNCKGVGVTVLENGHVIMYSGEISGNTNPYNPHDIIYGGGVYIIKGVFEMYGGKISGNNADIHRGGGVNNTNGVFKMYGGEISGNTASGDGGGVSNQGELAIFVMTGGKIINNSADNDGGGVYIAGKWFEITGGEISGNTAKGRGNDRYPESSDGTSSGNDETNNGNGDSNNGNNDETSDGNQTPSDNGGINIDNTEHYIFVIICVVGIIAVILGIVTIGSLLSFQKRLKKVEEKN